MRFVIPLEINVKEIYFYIILTIHLTNCRQSEPDLYFKLLDFKLPNKELISPQPPSPVAYNIVVLPIIKNGKKYKIIVQNFIAKSIYEKYYKNNFVSYPGFLQQSSENGFYINSKYFYQEGYKEIIDSSYYGYIQENNSIFTEYKNKGLDYIVNKYTSKQNSKYWQTYLFSKSHLSTETENCLINIMYKNQYFIKFNDIVGYYIFTKGKN